LSSTSGSREDAEPIESVGELVEYLRSGEKPPERWVVGTEHEKIGLHDDDHSPVPYEGERGIRAVLEGIAAMGGWEAIAEAGNVIELRKDGASITLEPGGQFELSGAPLRTIHETCDEFHRHLALMRQVCEPLGIAWLGLGIHPLHTVSEIPVMPKARYKIMRDYLPKRGALALDMMFSTATVQANFDYGSEPDMVEKLRTALAVQPLISAIFANSSLSGGKPNGFVSKRLQIWEHTDPDRCGALPFAFEADFGYARYVEWALDVPMFFIVRGGQYIAAKGLSFRQFMERGFGEHLATLADFDRHLTTLFPDVRLKRFIEVRGTDAVPPGLTCSLPAIWKGILYDAEARRAAWGLVAEASAEEREAVRADVPRRGLQAEYAGRPVLEMARELAEISRGGLQRIAHPGSKDADETGYLEPIFEQLALGLSPGSVVLQRWEGEWGRSVSRLIDYARY
jgi:glutamate--cysteine ligase